jgi:hypothetical protein
MRMFSPGAVTIHSPSGIPPVPGASVWRGMLFPPVLGAVDYGFSRKGQLRFEYVLSNNLTVW